MFISKGSYVYGEPKNVIALSVQRTHSQLRTSKLPEFVYRRIRSIREILENWRLPISQVQRLQLGNVYLKRKRREWGAQKCKRFVCTKNALAVTGLQTARVCLPQYMVNNGSLGKLAATYVPGTAVCTKAMFISKGGYVYGEPKNVIGLSLQKTHSKLQASKLPEFVYRPIWSIMEIWENWRLPISQVPRLHQGNVHFIRKLRVWGAYKCNRFVGAKNALTVTNLQTTRVRLPPYMVDNENFGKLEVA